MTCEVYSKVVSDYKNARLAHDTSMTECLSSLIASLYNKRIEVHHELNNEETIAVIKKEIKAKKEALHFAVEGGREDILEKWELQISNLEKYVPAEMPKEDIERFVRDVIHPGMNKGEAMKIVMKELRGKADGRVISEVVDKVLKR